jgi:hypothetical protein
MNCKLKTTHNIINKPTKSTLSLRNLTLKSPSSLIKPKKPKYPANKIEANSLKVENHSFLMHWKTLLTKKKSYANIPLTFQGISKKSDFL